MGNGPCCSWSWGKTAAKMLLICWSAFRIVEMFTEGIERSCRSFFIGWDLPYSKHGVSLKVLAFYVDFISRLTFSLPLLLLNIIFRWHLISANHRVTRHDLQSGVLFLWLLLTLLPPNIRIQKFNHSFCFLPEDPAARQSTSRCWKLGVGNTCFLTIQDSYFLFRG